MNETNLRKIRIITLEGNQDSGKITCPPTHTNDYYNHLPRFRLPSLPIDELHTQVNLKAFSKKLVRLQPDIENGWTVQDNLDISDMSTWILPIIHVEQITNVTRNEQQANVNGPDSPVAMLRKLVRSSGIYALSSVALPLVSLVLAPFLTHNLSVIDYGILTIINIAISLAAGITQLGLSAAFFRAYSYDYTSQQGRRAVVATITALLCLISISTAIIVAMLAPAIAKLLFGLSSLSNYITLAGIVVLLQNLTVPGLAWLRAEGHPLYYSILSMSNLLVTLLANIFLIGMLHWGVTGSIIANGSGYACIVICTLPLLILKAGIKIRVDIALSLLAFGLPLVLNVISFWVLQLSDRYLLGLFTSFAETARYAVVYTLGSAISVIVIGPFALAWPTTLFAIAKRKDAAQVFRLVFRWFSLFLLFAAFGLSLLGTILLDWLFPVTYHSAAYIIPIVALSIVFYGAYYVFIVGVNVKRKTWLISIFMTVAAVTNIGLNLVLIPHYGASGAAISTFIAYVMLAGIAYIVNQRLYPIPYEIDLFIIALIIGMVLYTGSDFLAQTQGIYVTWCIHIGALALYGGCLILLVIFPLRSREKNTVIKLEPLSNEKSI